MRFGAVSRATTVDATEEIYDRLARSGEVPPYLADMTPAAPINRGGNVIQPVPVGGTDAGGRAAPLREM